MISQKRQLGETESSYKFVGRAIQTTCSIILKATNYLLLAAFTSGSLVPVIEVQMFTSIEWSKWLIRLRLYGLSFVIK